MAEPQLPEGYQLVGATDDVQPPEGYQLVPPNRMAFAPPNLADSAPPMTGMDRAADIAKSAGIGVARGVVGLSTMPGNLEQLGRLGINKAFDVGTKLALGPNSNVPSPVSNDTVLPTMGGVIAKDEAQNGKWYEPQTTAGEYARTAGEFAPSMLAGGPEVGLATRAANVLGPAVASETAGQLTKGTAAEPYARAAAAIFGGKLPSATMRTITPLAVDATRAAHITNLEDQGVTALTAGQKTGARGLRYAESASGDAFLGGKKAQSMEDLQAQQFTRAALQHAGIDAEAATPDVIDQGFKGLGNTFTGLAKATSFHVDPKLSADLSNARASYMRLVPESQRAPIVNGLTDDIVNMGQNGGKVAGDQYQVIRSEIGAALKSAGPPEKAALGDIQEALDDAMERTASPQVASAWKAARTQYRNLLAITKAVNGAGEKTAQGMISPAQLRMAVKQQGDRSFARGQRPLGELARSGEAIMKPLPNSGTAARSAVMHALSVPGAAAGVAFGGPIGGLVGAVAPMVGQALSARTIMARHVQNALSNQVMAGPINAVNAGRPNALWRLFQGATGAAGAEADSNALRSREKR